VLFSQHNLRKLSTVTDSTTGIQTGDRTEMSGWMQQGAVAVYLQRPCLL